jgi:ATP-binding cassette subfamily C protein
VPAANRVGWRVNQVRSAAASVESLHDDYLLVAGTDWEHAAAERQSAQFCESIVLERVSYIFAQADNAALQDISLTIRFGESIGIVGPTGAGKTTLVDLVVGLLRPSSGRILIDGNDLGSRLLAWKRNIGYVPQSIFLIDDSLRRNIALGIGDPEIDEGRLRAAVRMAQLERFVAELPQGLETSVGERGIRLSGGERQRVGIARALYHDPDLLVFDEATSALDLSTEAALAEAIEALHGKKTLLVVAHRLSSVLRCDRLVFMSEGRIRACGSYDDLLRDHPEFQRMVRAQDRINPASA